MHLSCIFLRGSPSSKHSLRNYCKKDRKARYLWSVFSVCFRIIKEPISLGCPNFCWPLSKNVLELKAFRVPNLKNIFTSMKNTWLKYNYLEWSKYFVPAVWFPCGWSLEMKFLCRSGVKIEEKLFQKLRQKRWCFQKKD